MTGAGSSIVPRPASTVAVLRPAAAAGMSGVELLLTHRPATMAFGPGLHVFPGGAVDAEDGTGPLAARSVLDPAACAAAWAGDLEPTAALAHAIAGIRELYEEAGILLASHADGSPVDGRVVLEAAAHGTALHSLVERLDLVLRTDALVPLSRWVTPRVDVTRRYDTRFFVAQLPSGAEVAAHAHEVAAHGWSTPAEALDRFAAGEIDLWPPTATTLAQLDGVRELEDVRRWLSPVEPSAAPVVEAVVPGLTRVRVSGGGGIPGVRVDAWILGRERVIVVDPGGTTDRELDAILGTVSLHGASIGGIAVTSGAPDHVGGAVALALVTGAPLLTPPAAAPRIGDPALVVGDGESIEGIDVRVVARHVAGGCVYEAAELGVVLTGDLGTVGPSRAMPASWTGSAAAAELVARFAGRHLGAHGPAVGQAGSL